MSVTTMAQHSAGANPLGYASDATGSASSVDDIPAMKQATQSYRSTTYTPPGRCATLGPASVSHPLLPSPTPEATTENDDDAHSAMEEEDVCYDEDERPLPRSVTHTLPSLAGVGPTLSSSLISSHEASFCNSLIVSQGVEAEAAQMSFAHPPHISPPTHKGSLLTEGSMLSEADPHSGAVAAAMEDGAAASSARTAHAASPLHLTSSRPDSFSAHSPTGARPRHSSVTSPAGDVRTLHDLILWRAHLSDSQRSSETSHDHGGASPVCQSVPQPQPMLMKGIDANIAGNFPSSTPVTPGLWQPPPPTPARLHAPPSLPSLTDQTYLAPLSVTAQPHSSRDNLSPPSNQVSPVSAYPPPAPSSPHDLLSSRVSKSELGDSLASSSTTTSHITSPSGVGPLHHATTSPYDSKPRTEREGHFPHSNVSSPVLCTPATARATTVLDTRHVTPEMSVNVQHHGLQHAHHHPHRDLRGSSSGTGSRPASSPLVSSPALSEASGIEDHAPPHTRSAGFSCLSVASPTGPSITSRSSEASTSPRNGLPSLFPLHTTQDIVNSSLAGPTRGSPWSTAAAAHPHRTHSSVLTTPCQPNQRAAHETATKWRGLKAPEEYPAFATPVDDDTNKAVVAFVTGLLLLFCLGFIFAM